MSNFPPLAFRRTMIVERRPEDRVCYHRPALLQHPGPLATIAAELGFSDQAHFTRAFKRETGLTPGQFRRLARRGGNPGVQG